jgi:hypothetical protein
MMMMTRPTVASCVTETFCRLETNKRKKRKQNDLVVYRQAESRCVPSVPSPSRLGVSVCLGRPSPSDCRAAGGRSPPADVGCPCSLLHANLVAESRDPFSIPIHPSLPSHYPSSLDLPTRSSNVAAAPDRTGAPRAKREETIMADRVPCVINKIAVLRCARF